MALSRQNIIEILIQAKDEASATLQVVGGGLRSFINLPALAAGSTLGIVASKAIRLTAEMYSLGASVGRVREAFENLAGAQADEMLERMRIAARGTIDDYSLMLSANRAMMLQVTDDADTMARLVEVAIARGRAMGEPAQQAFDDLARGIGRLSPLILDNLGILTGGQKTYERYAASIGKTAEALTDAEKRQALLNLVLKDSTELTNDAASATETLTVAWANLKAAIGTQVAEGPLGGFQEDLAVRIENTTRAVERMGKEVSGYETARFVLSERYRTGQIQTLEEYQQLSQALEALTGTWEMGKISEEEYHEALRALIPDSELLTVALMEDARAYEDTSSAATAYSETLLTASNAASITASQIANLTEVLRSVGWEDAAANIAKNAPWKWISTDDIEEAAKRFGSVNDEAVKYLANMAYGRENASAMAEAQWQANYQLANASDRIGLLQIRLGQLDPNTKEYVQTLTMLRQVYRDVAGEAEAAAKEEGDRVVQLRGLAPSAKIGAGMGIGGLSEQAQELKSLISEIIQPTQVTALDMAATRLGVYTDKWDEYIRRLRSAATDANSAWKYLIPTDILAQGQDAIDLYVAEQERLLRTGQWEELIARGAPPDIRETSMDAMLADLRRRVIERQSMKRLQEELFQRAQAEGIGGILQSDIAAITGTPAAGAGIEMAENVQEGFLSTDIGGTLIVQFREQMQAHQKEWEEQGELTMSWWTAGLKRGISSDTIDALVGAIMPKLAEVTGGVP